MPDTPVPELAITVDAPDPPGNEFCVCDGQGGC